MPYIYGIIMDRLGNVSLFWLALISGLTMFYLIYLIYKEEFAFK